jgi:hypothetical protein
MENVNEDAQWIVLMGFLVSASFFFLAIVLNQSTVVGQTTAEGIVEFPKADIRDYKATVLKFTRSGLGGESLLDISTLSLGQRNAVVSSVTTCWDPPDKDPFDPLCLTKKTRIHYSNGVTAYNDTATYK